MASNKIGILGCGWFGLPLARHLLQKGYDVAGSVRTESKKVILESSGVKPFIFDLTKNPEYKSVEEFLNVDYLIIAIPPGRQTNKTHLEQIQDFLRNENNPERKIIYISSTSVYADSNNIVDETDKNVPEKGNGAILRSTEDWLAATYQNCVVLRFGGLIGSDRNPVKYFAGRKNIPGGRNPVNLVHLDDCIGITSMMIAEKFIPGVYNVCSPDHPSKHQFYSKSAKSLGLEIPRFEDNFTSYKIISPDLFVQTFGYRFKYNSPLEML